MEAPWFTPGENGTFRLWPHRLLGEGHFAAVLKKEGDREAWQEDQKQQPLPKEWNAVAQQLDIRLPAGKPVLFGQSLYWAPVEMPELRGLKVLRPGLELGEVKKDRFTPAHGLALWLQEAKNVVDLAADSSEIRAFLHGETIPAETVGWCLVRVDGFPIGWGKGDGKIIKNHYPKGLRR